MIPDVPNSEFEIVSYDTRTFKLNLDNNTIAGMIDDVEALKQTIETILMTERYKWVIYSWGFGCELENLIGKNPAYVQSELKRRITEALLVDDRITNVSEFKFDEANTDKFSLTVNMTVETIYGNVEEEVVI